MNPIVAMSGADLAGRGVELAGQGAKAAGKAAGSLFNEPIVGRFTLKKLTVWMVAAFVLYLVWYFFFRKSAAEKAADKAAETVNGITINSSNISLSTNDINLISQQLYNAMEPWGTDEEAIVSTLDRLSTKDDLLAVMKRFGTPQYGSWIEGYRFLDLTGWLKAELGGSVLTHVRNVFLNFGIPF